jgi:hypothetical protein
MKPTDPASPNDKPRGPAWHRTGSEETSRAPNGPRTWPTEAGPSGRAHSVQPGPVPHEANEGLSPADARARHDHHAQMPDDMQNEGVAHEESDVNVRAILSFAGIVAVVSIVCALIVWGMMVAFESSAEGRETRRSPLSRPSTQMPNQTDSPFFGAAPQPQLLTNEFLVHDQLRDTETAALTQYGWVDQQAGVARLPIDQAKKLLSERGLPSRSGGSDPALGTNAPAYGESAGGRNIPNGQTPAAAAGAGAQDAQPQQPAPSAAPAPTPAAEHAPTGRGGGA